MNRRGTAYVIQVEHREVLMSGSKLTVRLLGGAATVLLASACGSTVTPGAGTAPVKATAPTRVLGVATTSLGPVLVDHSGLTVYLLTADTPGHSSCSAMCLQYWPLVPAPAGSAPSVAGISAALSFAKATSGASMLTAGGWPLYTFVKDKAPGDVTGQGVKTFGGTWYAVSPSGAAVMAAPKSAPTTTGGGVYGY
jgi:predicted lipoprotein with Yx(FWY)xxD motif